MNNDIKPELKKLDIELDLARNFTIVLNPHCNFEAEMNFYYDETNNVKKFQFKNGNLNVSQEMSFLLGGLTYEGDRPDISGMFSIPKLDANATEVKFRHICRSGELLDCLKSSLLTPFLKFLRSKNLYIHYSSLNVLYYGLADIIDSALENYAPISSGDQRLPFVLKNTLYNIAVLDKEEFTQILYSYDYPNVPNGSAGGFVNDLLSLVKRHMANPKIKDEITMLVDLFEFAAKKPELLFLTGEKKHVIIDGFVELYKRPIYLFTKSKHHFDNESDIQTEINKYNYKYNGQILDNFSFSDSKADQLTQASDVIVGLLGKVSNFVNNHTIAEIEEVLRTLNNSQLNNLNLIRELAGKTNDYNMALIHYTESLDNIFKWQMVLYPKTIL